MKPNLIFYHPCEDGLEYYNSKTTFAEAWEQCPRGDWMLWLAQKLGIEHKLLIKTSALCANTVRHLMTDKCSIRAIDVALAYADGKATEEELEIVANAAAAAAYAAYADAYAAAAADAAAAYADADAAAADAAAVAYAAYAAAYAVANAAAYAANAAYVANAANAANAKKTNQLLTADICREQLTEAVFLKIDNQ